MRPPGVQVLEFLKAEDDSSALDALTLLVDSRHDDILNGIHPHSRVELHKALFLKVRISFYLRSVVTQLLFLSILRAT